jgi:hypothetical protein
MVVIKGDYLAGRSSPSDGLAIRRPRKILEGVGSAHEMCRRNQGSQDLDLATLAVLHFVHRDHRVATTDPGGDVWTTEQVSGRGGDRLVVSFSWSTSDVPD